MSIKKPNCCNDIDFTNCCSVETLSNPILQ